MNIKSRFAPSPSGPMHLGNIVSALYVWGITKALNGTIQLRIDDHDQQRSKNQWSAMIIEDLHWLGMYFDEYSIQSQNNQKYQHAFEILAEKNLVYTCHCTRNDINKHQSSSHTELYYPGTCRNTDHGLSNQHGIRVKIPESIIDWNDLKTGTHQDCPLIQCGDFLIKDRKQNWTYQFCSVVDDVNDNINLIIRGEDIQSSTARQILLQQLLYPEADRKHYFHHTLLMDSQNQEKLGKRTQSEHFRSMAESKCVCTWWRWVCSLQRTV